jgi:hypothetical protein
MAVGVYESLANGRFGSRSEVEPNQTKSRFIRSTLKADFPGM